MEWKRSRWIGRGLAWLALGATLTPWAIAQTSPSAPALATAEPASPPTSNSGTIAAVAPPPPSAVAPLRASRPKQACTPRTDASPEACRAITLGYRVGVGLTGARRSVVPAQSLGLGVELPLGGALRYHGGLAAHELRGWYGVLVTPLSLGYLVRVVDRPGLSARVEPVLDVLAVEELFTRTGHAALVGAGAWLRGAVYWGPWLLGLTPIGVHVRYLYLSGSRPDTRGVLAPGVDWILRIDLGRQFP